MSDTWLTSWIRENAAMLNLEAVTPDIPEQDSLQNYLMAYVPTDPSSPPELGTVGERFSGKSRSTMTIPEDSDEDLLFNEEFLYGKRRRKQKKSSFGLEGSTTVNMTPEASKIMGQANQAFVQKEYTTARDLFLEVVRLSPSSHEPYYTLGVIYQELNDVKAALNYYMIAAHLRKNDTDLWELLLDLFSNQGIQEGRLYCAKKLSKLRPESVADYFLLADIYSDLQKPVKVLETLLRALRLIPNDMELLDQIAHLGMEIKNMSPIIATLEDVLSKSVYPFHEIDEKLLYWLCQFYFLQGESSKLHELFEVYINPKYDKIELPVALTYFKAVNYGYLRDYDGLQDIVDFLLKSDIIEENTIKIAKFLCDSHYYHLALPLVRHILLDPQHQTSFWYMKEGVCMSNLQLIDEAIKSYERSIELEPENIEAKLNLAQAYRAAGSESLFMKVIASIGSVSAPTRPLNFLDEEQIGDVYFAEEHSESDDEDKYVLPLSKTKTKRQISSSQRALKAEKMRRKFRIHRFSPEECKIMRNLYQKFLFLHSEDPNDYKFSYFLDCAQELMKDFLSNPYFFPRKVHFDFTVSDERKEPFKWQLNDEENELLSQTYGQSIEAGKTSLVLRLGALHGIEVHEWIQIILQYAEVLYHLKKYRMSAKVIQRALCSNIIHLNEETFLQFQFLMLWISVQSAEPRLIAESWRRISRNCDNQSNISLYYILAAICPQSFGSQVDYRYIKRQVTAHPTHPGFQILLAQISAASRSYYETIQFWNSARKNSSEALAYLGSGISYLSYSMSRKVLNRNYAIGQAFCLFKEYFRLLDGNADACYNMGRAFHQISLNHLACKYYKMALEKIGLESKNQVELRLLTAHNLSLIYINSKSYILAHKTLSKYAAI